MGDKYMTLRELGELESVEEVPMKQISMFRQESNLDQIKKVIQR